MGHDMYKPDGFVVVTLWKHARSRSSAMAYEHYERIEDAAAHYRNPGPQFTPHGIFATKDGMPVGQPLAADIIACVAGGKMRCYGLREYQPNSPENMRYREDRRASGRPPGAPRGVPGVTFGEADGKAVAMPAGDAA